MQKSYRVKHVTVYHVRRNFVKKLMLLLEILGTSEPLDAPESAIDSNLPPTMHLVELHALASTTKNIN
jgi:hypothetical protein